MLHGSTFDGDLEPVQTGPAIAIDSNGDAFVAGVTGSADFPQKNAPQPNYGGGFTDAFLTELNPAGSGLVLSTFIGGANGDAATGVSVDAAGNAYATGYTASPNMPVTTGAYQAALRGARDAWVAKMPKVNPAAPPPSPAFTYVTYLGGTDLEDSFGPGGAIASDGDGNAYVTGDTFSTNFPTTAGAYQTAPNGADAFITKLNPTGTALVFSTLFGGNGAESGLAIAVDPDRRVFVAGQTSSFQVFPTTPDAVLRSFRGNVNNDAFLMRLSAAGSALDYSTYLGGGEARGIALDGLGNAYVTGRTLDRSLPATTGAFQPIAVSGSTGFALKLEFAAPPKLAVNAITPNVGGDIGVANVTVTGANFQQGAQLSLAGSAYPTIDAQNEAVSADGRSMTASLNLTGAPDQFGPYDVVVTNPDGTHATLVGGYGVSKGLPPIIWTDIVGPSGIRSDRPQTYYIEIGNAGNVNAYVVPLFIQFSDTLLWTLPDKILPPEPSTISDSEWATQPISVNVDNEVQLPLELPVVPPGRPLIIPLTLQPRSDIPFDPNRTFDISSTAGQPFLGYHIALQVPGLMQSLTAASADQEPPNVGPAEPTSSATDCVLAITGEILSILGIKQWLTCLNTARITILSYMNSLAQSEASGAYPGVRSWALIYANLASFLFSACGAGVFPGVGQALSLIQAAIGVQDLVLACPFPESVKNLFRIKFEFSADPNQLTGPAGYGTQRYVSGKEPLEYAASAENIPTATAAAQRVAIDVTLPPGTDPSSVDFGPVIVGNSVVVPPPGGAPVDEIIDRRPAENVIIHVTGNVDTAAGAVHWLLQALDPDTGEPPVDPQVGVLPPDVTPPNGEATALFSVTPNKSITDGSSLTASGQVVFDTNPAIATNAWSNTVDNVAPTADVSSLPTIQRSAAFDVSWTGTDSESGLSHYTLYASENGGGYFPAVTDTPDTSFTFTGDAGATYKFLVVVADNVGNTNGDQPGRTASTTVNLPPAFVNGVADSRTGQYSDPMAPYTITASDPDDDPHTLAITATGLPSGLTITDNHDGSATVSGRITAAGGIYTPRYTVADSAGPVTVTGGSITVKPEDASVLYTGPTLVSAGIATTVGIPLSAQVIQAADGALGDITRAKVTFQLFSSSNLSTTPTATYGPIAVDTNGNASYTTPTLPLDAYTVIPLLSAMAYFAGPPGPAALVTTYQITTGRWVTGGGWVSDQSAGGNHKGAFGFTVRLRSGTTTPAGQSVFTYTGTDGYRYLVKSTSWTGGGLGFTGAALNHAFFSGKATVIATDPVTGLQVPGIGGGNYQFRVDATDIANADTYAITITTPAGKPFHQAGTSTAGLPLGGGNIAVHAS
jgi:hypothetical protein